MLTWLNTSMQKVEDPVGMIEHLLKDAKVYGWLNSMMLESIPQLLITISS